jgi:hypothetical protein
VSHEGVQLRLHLLHAHGDGLEIGSDDGAPLRHTLPSVLEPPLPWRLGGGVGGGGGAVPSGNFTTIPGTGGLGGGGNGSNTRNTDRQSQCDGAPNTGGGGGGVATSRYFGSFTPGSGATGIVVVRYIH